jgi:DNA-binding LytR/AlgR family response regulator
MLYGFPTPEMVVDVSNCELWVVKKNNYMRRAMNEKTNPGTVRDMTFRHTEVAAIPFIHPHRELPGTTNNLSSQLAELLQLLNPEQQPGATYKNRFLIRKGHQYISLPVTDIRYFYSKEKLCFVKTLDNKDYVLPYTITEIEEMVAPALFFRASRKYIVSHAAITKILVWFNGKLKVEIQPGTAEDIIISRDRVNGFKIWLGE